MIEQRSEAWFAARLGKLTASRISDMRAKIASGKPAASRANLLAQLVCERLTGKPTEMFESADMRRGTELEPAARAAYEAQTGNIVEPAEFVTHATILDLGASPDGLIDTDGLVELKCLNAASHIALLQTGVHAKYLDQVHTQMLCTGRSWCDLAFYHPDFPEALQLKVIRIQADGTFQDAIEQEARAFLREVASTVEQLKRIAA